MPSRANELEKAFFQFEGAIFCLRDILARIIVQTPAIDADTMIQRLADRAHTFADQLGPERLTGYIDELQMLRTEMGELKVSKQPRWTAIVK